MAIGDLKERINERRDAIYAAMTAAFSAAGPYTERVVTRNFKGMTEHSNEDLDKGVLIMLCDRETDYSRKFGMVGREGALVLLIVGHLRVNEGTTRSAIEDKEISLIEELKLFFRAGVPGMSFVIEEFRQSLQRFHPLGFVAGRILVTPPINTQT